MVYNICKLTNVLGRGGAMRHQHRFRPADRPASRRAR